VRLKFKLDLHASTILFYDENKEKSYIESYIVII